MQVCPQELSDASRHTSRIFSLPCVGRIAVGQVLVATFTLVSAVTEDTLHHADVICQSLFPLAYVNVHLAGS
jgi:hypothetical protein